MSETESRKAAPVRFDWEGTRYEFDSAACNATSSVVQLPDKTLLGVTGWYESWPPKPSGFRRINPEGLVVVCPVPAARVLPTVAICGYGRAGKDTVGKTLRRKTALTYSGSLSWVGLPYMAKRLKVCEQEAWEERHEKRMLWKQYLDEYRANDPARLIRESLQRGQLVVGVRDGVELRAAREEGLLDHVWWVHREGTPVDPTVTYSEKDCDRVIRNDGSLEDLDWLVESLVDELKLPRR